MSIKHFHVLASTLVIMATSAATPAIAQYASAIVDSVTSVGYGRYRITGTALDSRGNAACALALASGRCMFTCGAGSLRCEGGTAYLPFGRFDLTDLPTEANGTIILQVFVQGNISYAGTIPINGPLARWSAYNDTCCRNNVTGVVYTSTFEVTVDGVTKRSISNSCTPPPTFEGFASTTPGAKSWTARLYSSACPGGSWSGNVVTMAPNTCYKFQLNISGGEPVISFISVSCPSSTEANTLQEESQATPMAIFPAVPEANEGAKDPAATYQPIQH